MKAIAPRDGGNSRRIRWILAGLLAGALTAGLLLDQAGQLFAYAWPLCLPCMGIQ